MGRRQRLRDVKDKVTRKAATGPSFQCPGGGEWEEDLSGTAISFAVGGAKRCCREGGGEP